MCSQTLATKGAVSVRAIGLPAAETLVSSAFFAPQWEVVVGYGVRSLLDYFQGDNAPKRTFLSARTTPITFRQRSYPNGTVYEWTSAIMVSTAAFPDAAALPEPIDPLKLEPVGSRLVAVRQFSTPSFPSQADCAAACGGVTQDTLPPGYTIDSNSTWSPTYALYSRENSPVYENECWVEVVAAK
jgi:hypothetical protein